MRTRNYFVNTFCANCTFGFVWLFPLLAPFALDLPLSLQDCFFRTCICLFVFTSTCVYSCVCLYVYPCVKNAWARVFLYNCVCFSFSSMSVSRSVYISASKRLFLVNVLSVRMLLNDTTCVYLRVYVSNPSLLSLFFFPSPSSSAIIPPTHNPFSFFSLSPQREKIQQECFCITYRLIISMQLFILSLTRIRSATNFKQIMAQGRRNH